MTVSVVEITAKQLRDRSEVALLLVDSFACCREARARPNDRERKSYQARARDLDQGVAASHRYYRGVAYEEAVFPGVYLPQATCVLPWAEES